jgi:hypothetical protein
MSALPPGADIAAPSASLHPHVGFRDLFVAIVALMVALAMC